MRRLVLSADQKKRMRRRGKFCPHIVGCRSSLGEGLHVEESKAIKVYTPCQSASTYKSLGRISHFGVICFCVFVGRWIKRIWSDGDKQSFHPFNRTIFLMNIFDAFIPIKREDESHLVDLFLFLGATYVNYLCRS